MVNTWHVKDTHPPLLNDGSNRCLCPCTQSNRPGDTGSTGTRTRPSCLMVLTKQGVFALQRGGLVRPGPAVISLPAGLATRLGGDNPTGDTRQ